MIKWWKRKDESVQENADNSSETKNIAAKADSLTESEKAELERLSHKIEVDVVLKSAGRNLIAVIKVLRSRFNLELQQAKALAESAPTTIATAKLKDEALALARELRAFGAEVELI